VRNDIEGTWVPGLAYGVLADGRSDDDDAEDSLEIPETDGEDE
jgi:hypothetical protein